MDNSEETIDVGIDIPGDGKFNTMKNGTTTKNGKKGESGGLFKNPSSLTTTAIPGVIYAVNE